ncbi:MAG: flagellin [Lachnospiraceae bacterium]|nr:flagellin [Lachnospiraceae bacterium]
MSSITKINAVTGYGQIASGKKINRAADNAASMAIANKLRANANATNVAARNTREGIGVTKIADGGYDSIMDRLQSIRELAVKAMNGTNSDDDRSIIQDEINQQLAGIDESARNTIYNQTKLMDGSYATLEIASNPTGKGSEIRLESARLDAIGISGFNVTGGSVDLDAIDRAIEKVSADRSALGASANGLAARERANQVAYENMTAARSRIEDLDMAKASADLKRDETLQGVQIAMFRREREQEADAAKLLY